MPVTSRQIHGQGLAERLMRASRAAADADGYRPSSLVCRATTGAQALYRTLGFVEAGVKRQRVLSDGIDHEQIRMATLRT